MSGSPLIVALVSTQRGWHGGEEQARLLAFGLRDRGHRCVMIARGDGAFATRMQGEGFEVRRFPGSGRSPWAVWRIRRHLRQLQPDVLHYNDPHAMTAAGMAALGLRVPARIVARRVSFPIRSPWLYRWLADRIVCVSRDVVRVCREAGLAEATLQVVHDGVDPSRMQTGDAQRGRHALGLRDDQTLLLCVATLTDAKGHQFLLEALPNVLKQRPQTILALAGDGELRGVLEQQTKQLGIEQNVWFLGYRQDVPDLVAACDLFVLASHREGLCSTLIDVMLAGRPIVTTTAGGIPDLVIDNTTSEPFAWTVPPRDATALSEAIFAALNSPERSAELRDRAQQRAKQHFTASRMVEATLAVYEEVMKR